ncbi:MAG TPA: carboxypeptidase-like regulatory domain-containing protein, partial [Bacteroidia bacterium]
MRFLFLLFIMLSPLLWRGAGGEVFSQTYPLSGKISDSKKNSLPFSSVVVKGTTIGTNSNADGVYAFKLPAGTYEIIYQYIGYKKETK